MGGEPGLEALHVGVERAALLRILAQIREVQPVELEHIGEFFGARESQRRVSRAGDVLVHDLAAQNAAHDGGVFGRGQAFPNHGHGLAEQFRPAVEDGGDHTAQVGYGDGRERRVALREAEGERAVWLRLGREEGEPVLAVEGGVREDGGRCGTRMAPPLIFRAEGRVLKMKRSTREAATASTRFSW